MPIYEYECDKCGVTFEAMQGISAKPLKTCNGLGCDDKDNGKVRRIVSASGFILKGSGWYASDYPSEDRKKGWEKESKQPKGNSDIPDAPAPDAKNPAPDAKAPAAEKKAKAEPAPVTAKKPTAKSPYSSGKTKNAKGSK
jgi:putative FmdB family regulatory protein